MIWLYRLLFPLALLGLLPRYWGRMRRRGGYEGSWAHRFGFQPALGPVAPGRRRLWVQAVSVGELQALGALLPALAATGRWELVLTTTTSTGYALAREKFAPLCRHVGWFPVDFWPCARLAWRRLRPDAVLLLEGELWPEHLHRARRAGVPVLLANARLSDRSHRRFRRFAAFARWVYGQPVRVLAQTPEVAGRLRGLGVPPERLSVSGNLKIDVALGTAARTDDGPAARAELGWAGPETLILLGSSTWPGEEAALLAALRAARAGGLDARLLLVPRHMERRDELSPWLAASGLAFAQRSGRGPLTGAELVHLADTTGELARLTAAADLVFVGKSLPPHTEGQTPLEAAARGKALLFGPGMGNFREAAAGLVAAGAAEVVPTAAALPEAVARLLAAPAERARRGAAAQSWIAAHAGATARTVAALDEIFSTDDA